MKTCAMGAACLVGLSSTTPLRLDFLEVSFDGVGGFGLWVVLGRFEFFRGRLWLRDSFVTETAPANHGETPRSGLAREDRRCDFAPAEQ